MLPRRPLLRGKFMMEIVLLSLWPGHQMVLATIDSFRGNPERLHHRRPSSAQVMGRPLTKLSFREHKRVVVPPSVERTGSVHEPHLTVAYLLADGLCSYMR